VSPADGAEDVPLDTTVSVTFSERMDEAVDPSEGLVIEPSVPGEVRWVYHRLVFEPDGNLTDNTTYTMTVRRSLTDAAGNPLAAEVSWSFTTVGLENEPPMLAPWPDTREVEVLENQTIRLGVLVEDDGPPPIRYSWLLDGLRVVGEAGDNMVYSPGYMDHGTHQITVVVSDGASPPAEATFTWTVTVVNVNLPPQLVTATPDPGPIQLFEGSGTKVFTVNASDPDEGYLEFSWHLDGREVPEGIISDNGSSFVMELSWDAAGNHTLVCTVSDRMGASFDVEWQVEVVDVNRPPVIFGIEPEVPPTVEQGVEVAVRVNATDPDGDVLTYNWSVDGEPVLSTTEPEWSFSSETEGSYVIDVQVDDGRGGVTDTFTMVNVLPDSSPPPDPTSSWLPWLLVIAVLIAIALVLLWPKLRRH
jgi:hypothetical protein